MQRQKMMNMRWHEDETRIFVKLYLSHEFLWNQEHEEYKLKFQRQQAYRDIIAKFSAITNISLDEREVRRKIKNLKATYNQELAKIKERSTATTTYKSTIKWFADWHKCFKNLDIKRMKEERSSCDEPQDGSIDDSAQKVWISEDPDNTEADGDTDKDPFVSPTDEDYILLLKTEPDDTKSSKPDPPKPYKRKRKMKRRSPSIDQLVDSYRGRSTDSSTEPATTTSKEDEFDIYGKYIASQLRHMGLQRALRVQLQIQSIVSEARIETLSSDQD